MTDPRKTDLTVGKRDDVIRVTIMGREYPIRADADEAYIRKIASYLDERMNAVMKADPGRTPLNIAVLTALNLADELFALKRDRQKQLDAFTQKAKDFSRQIEKELLD